MNILIFDDKGKQKYDFILGPHYVHAVKGIWALVTLLEFQNTFEILECQSAENCELIFKLIVMHVHNLPKNMQLLSL